MGDSGTRVREALMDATEELFAKHGIDAVSNRCIPEHAGNANNSAVGYHFGSRDRFLTALFSRYLPEMARRTDELHAQLGENPSVYDVIRARFLPLIEELDRLPRPSWRAQFLAQTLTLPSVSANLEQTLGTLPGNFDSEPGNSLVEGVSDSVWRARSGIVKHMLLGACASQERKMNDGTATATWLQLGYFLIDAQRECWRRPSPTPISTPRMSQLTRTTTRPTLQRF